MIFGQRPLIANQQLVIITTDILIPVQCSFSYQKMSTKSNKAAEKKVRTLEEVISQQEKKYIGLEDKYEVLIDKLKDRIECPVCYEIPVAGPVYSCVNGHLVCSNCKRDSCPTCRGKIKGKSLLAVDIIVSIEHKCKNEECEQLVAYNSVEKHAQECKFRTILCPAYACREGISPPSARTLP